MFRQEGSRSKHRLHGAVPSSAAISVLVQIQRISTLYPCLTLTETAHSLFMLSRPTSSPGMGLYYMIGELIGHGAS